MKESDLEQESVKTASQINIENQNPKIWRKLVELSTEDQDKEWFRLSQKHLKEYKDGEVDTQEFKDDEDALIFLNHIGAEARMSLDPLMKQRGFSFDNKERFKKFERFGLFVEKIQQEIKRVREKSENPVYIMISGIGISGKATLRSVLTGELTRALPSLRIVSIDRDYEKIFPPQIPADVYLVEDVHGLDLEKDSGDRYKRFDGDEGVPGGFDIVVYSLSSAATYRRSLIQRGVGWIRMGKIDLTAITHDKDFSGGDVVKKTAAELTRTQEVGSQWFKEQLGVLRSLKNKDIPIMVVDPTEIFKVLYGFEDNQNVANNDFETALSEALEK